MNDNTKIKYTFHNKIGETVEMTFTMTQIECMEGGFRKFIMEELVDMNFGDIAKIYRMVLV